MPGHSLIKGAFREISDMATAIRAAFMAGQSSAQSAEAHHGQNTNT